MEKDMISTAKTRKSTKTYGFSRWLSFLQCK